MSGAVQQGEQALSQALQRLAERYPSPSVAHVDRRENSLIALVETAPGTPRLYVKVFRPRSPAPADVSQARQRVQNEHDSLVEIQRAFAQFAGVDTIEPVACWPDLLALVTREAAGCTLLADIERDLKWVPTVAGGSPLRRACIHVGRWLRHFQSSGPAGDPLMLREYEDYVDHRLRRIVEGAPRWIDEELRARLLAAARETWNAIPPEDLPRVRSHADLSLSNILVHDGRITVLDLAMTAVDGRYLDVARLYTQLQFLTAKPAFRPRAVAALQQALLEGYDPRLQPGHPLFRLYVIQHVVCHVSNLSLNRHPWPGRLFNLRQLTHHRHWLQSLSTGPRSSRVTS